MIGTNLRRWRLPLLAFVCGWTVAVNAEVVIKLGTIAPEGSIWHDVLLETRRQWNEISHGEVELRIYANGVLGGEDEMIRKMQRRSLDALAISGAGLPLIDTSVDCLNLPLLFDSYEELERVRGAIAGELEASFAERGYVVLNWAEAGWVHFFAKSPVRTVEDLRRLRLWTATGNPQSERIAKGLGFRVVPLPATDMLMGLQTGLIEAIDVPPLFALLDRSYQAAPYMTDLRFAPLNAATVITAASWSRVPAQYRDRLRAAAQQAAVRLRQEIHQAEREAIAEMAKRGLTIVTIDAETEAAWRREARSIYPELGCRREYPELFEKVMRLQNAMRTP
jgi:TRAP-type C4-dicarboxylate transport system substrate-binding protein